MQVSVDFIFNKKKKKNPGSLWRKVPINGRSADPAGSQGNVTSVLLVAIDVVGMCSAPLLTLEREFVATADADDAVAHDFRECK